jgi:uncharacterized protein (DUF305 family)
MNTLLCNRKYLQNLLNFYFIIKKTLLLGFFLLCSTGLIFLSCSGTEPVTEAEVYLPERDLSSLEELYWSRLAEARLNFIQADVDFMTDMIVHHAQALIMSRLAPENDASPVVQTLAARIINAQEGEIATMQKWLRDRGQPVPLVHIEGVELMIHTEDSGDDEGHAQHAHHSHGHHDMSNHDDMPGMLTQEQLEHLASVRGSEFDRVFLEYMIEHHEGAVIMVQELFDADGAANDSETFDLASDIHAEQVTEINRMQWMLDQMAADFE